MENGTILLHRLKQTGGRETQRDGMREMEEEHTHTHGEAQDVWSEDKSKPRLRARTESQH